MHGERGAAAGQRHALRCVRVELSCGGRWAWLLAARRVVAMAATKQRVWWSSVDGSSVAARLDAPSSSWSSQDPGEILAQTSVCADDGGAFAASFSFLLASSRRLIRSDAFGVKIFG